MMARGSREMASAIVSTSGKTAPSVAAKIAMRPLRSEKYPLPRRAPVMPWVTGSMNDLRNAECTRLGGSSNNLDQGVTLFDDFTDDAGRNAATLHRSQRGICNTRRDCYEQAAGSLRIEKESAEFFGNGVLELDAAFDEVAIIFHSAGEK